MKIFKIGKDGGPESTVTGYFVCEFKRLFSIVLLKFEGKSRDAFHSHAFNCISWLISGKLVENHLDGRVVTYAPSIVPIVTMRDTYHKVDSDGTTYVISFRGPWSNSWKEYLPDQYREITLTNGRIET